MSLSWMSWCPQIGFRAFWSNAVWPKHIWTTQLFTQSFGHQLIFLCAARFDQMSVGQVIFDHKTRSHRRVWNFYFVGHWTWFVVCTGIKINRQAMVSQTRQLFAKTKVELETIIFYLLRSGNSNCTGRLGTVHLLVLTSLDQLFLKLQTLCSSLKNVLPWGGQLYRTFPLQLVFSGWVVSTALAW